MKNLRKKSLAAAVVVAPLLMAVGCASDRHNLAQSEAITEPTQQAIAVQEPTAATAIANMDGYMAQLSGTHAEVVETEPTTETVASDETDQISQSSMTDEELLLAEVMGAGPDQIKPSQPDDTKMVLPPPQQLLFQFGFNKNELAEADRAALQEHSDYLLQHPNYVLIISGHTDNRGSEIYNQKLSEQRAQSVADLLIAAGVPASQLRVNGMGGKVPRVSPDNWDENRRVEFVYQDTMMANNQ